MDAHAILDAVLADVAGKVERAGHGHSAVRGSAVQGLLIPGYAPDQVMPCMHTSTSCPVKVVPGIPAFV